MRLISLFFLMCIYFCYLRTEDYGLKMGPWTVEIPAFAEYLLKLVDNVRLKCFGAHWAASSRHGSLFTQQCYSPTRCYGKFGSHKELESSGEGYYLSRFPTMVLLIPFKVNAGTDFYFILFILLHVKNENCK